MHPRTMETHRQRAERERKLAAKLGDKQDEKERVDKMKAAHFAHLEDGAKLFVYPACQDGLWKNIDVFFDHFNMTWRYRCTGAAVGTKVAERIVQEIKRREFELLVQDMPEPPRPCPSCGQETNES